MYKYSYRVFGNISLDTEVFMLPPTGVKCSLLHYKRTVNIQFLGNEIIFAGKCASLG